MSKKIKNYSEENLEQMAKAETLVEFLSEIPENYDFGDDEISAQISVYTMVGINAIQH
jgi:hypothetical protein